MERTLEALCTRVGWPLGPEVGARILSYLELVGRWGQRINLTGDPSPATLLTQQLPDAFVLASLLQEGATGRCLDVGSGAGLVAIPLALLLPGLSLTLVEPNQRKGAFLRMAVHELQLRIEVRTVRLEAVRERFEVVMSRATWAPEEWLEKGRGVVSEDGRIVTFTRGRLEVTGFAKVAERSYELREGIDRCVSVWRTL